jgi:hypothetical protein
LVGERLLNLRLRLRNLLGEWIVGFVRIGVASKVREGVVSGGSLRNGGQTRSRARDHRNLSRNLRSLGGRGQGSTRGNRGMLRRLSTGLSVFSVLIDISLV